MAVCCDCGEDSAAEGRQRCQRCLDRRNAAARELYARRREASGPTDPERLGRSAGHARERRARLRAQGLCVQCRKASPRYAHCARCREKAAGNRRVRRFLRAGAAEPRSDLWIAWRRDQRHQRREAGLCTGCGDPAGRFARCLSCRQASAEAQRRFRDKRRLAA
jgi:hypothetical protein